VLWYDTDILEDLDAFILIHPEAGGNMVLQNFGILQHCMASQPKQP